MLASSRALFSLSLLLLVQGTARVAAQDDDEPFLPGLAATYRDDHGHEATRLDHQLAFHWGQTPPDPRLNASEFQATWRGSLLATPRGEYRFFVFGSGEIELKIADRVVLKRQTLRDSEAASAPIALTADYHPLELSFRRSAKAARLMLLWSGPDFGREPIPARVLFHPRDKPIADDFERGRLLARALRCGRCHGEDVPASAGPALDRLNGNLSRRWLVDWLIAKEQSDEPSPRRMPTFGLSNEQAETIADWLLSPRKSAEPTPLPSTQTNKKAPKPSAKEGERLFVSRGCLACHTWGNLGASGWFGGGDLSHVAEKRPPRFFADWLADPARFNREHRMPLFQLADAERNSLSLFLAERKTSKEKPIYASEKSDNQSVKGRDLIERFRCAACHRLPETPSNNTERAPPRLNAKSDWNAACTNLPDAAKNRPDYRLNANDARALQTYYAGMHTERRDGQLLLAEHNCLACHAREGAREALPFLPPVLADKLIAVVKRYPDLAPRVAELTPPALNSVGDKLADAALEEAIARRGAAHRPYLQVKMPRFSLPGDELPTLVRQFIDTDRVPATNTPADSDATQRERYRVAGGRLVSGDGFGCTSCHAVGRVQPASDSASARGPDLALLDRRIRRPWFDRWVHNPARIVPRMEMPSVQIPVSGVLDGELSEQLHAVWYVLNQPGFEPPLPNPIRTLRHTGNRSDAEPIVLTDILQKGSQKWVKPFLVGLANRHTVLIDLETGGLAQWNVGDVARQHARGKAWFWESAGTAILDTALVRPDVSLLVEGRESVAQPLGQFVTEADAWQIDGACFALDYRLKFLVPTGAGGETNSVVVRVHRKFAPLATGAGKATSGFTQELSASGIPTGARLRLRLFSASVASKTVRSADGRALRLGDRFDSRVVLLAHKDSQFAQDSETITTPEIRNGDICIALRYESSVPVDRYPETPQPTTRAGKVESIELGPGLSGVRLPLPPDIMPTGLAWRPDGRLVFCSLKGQVYEARDSNGDGIEHRLRLLVDGLPAPYGIHAERDYVDVSAKYALLRLRNDSTRMQRIEALASGWGYSSDYHDWVVGLPRNDLGEYFLGIPCQQDERSIAAARFHGHVLRLSPREPTPDDPHRFALSSLSTGHRFPMGLALNRTRELFVTDNQGNYKPFNELNHVRTGAHFGFVNYLERGKPMPPRTPPALDIPHPWTRSVNGICFLYTPKKLGHDVFGPLEGHLIGCEYDTRRLIRMTLQRVGDTFQGAAYPFSIPPDDPQHGFLGPLVCAVSPRGELYVGSIRDSGWGGGNNVGEIVRVRIHPEKLPCGIAQVRATNASFTLDFFQPIDRERASQIANYAIQSYRRESTPAYGGPDLDRRTEKVTQVVVSPDARRVTLKLAEMRAGFVYELRLQNLAPGGGDFHPAEAYYTMRVVPK